MGGVIFQAPKSHTSISAQTSNRKRKWKKCTSTLSQGRVPAYVLSRCGVNHACLKGLSEKQERSMEKNVEMERERKDLGIAMRRKRMTFQPRCPGHCGNLFPILIHLPKYTVSIVQNGIVLHLTWIRCDKDM